MTRQMKTPEQRAREALAAAERAVKRAEKKRDDAQDAFKAANEEWRQATIRRNYAANHPDLQADEPLPGTDVIGELIGGAQ